MLTSFNLSEATPDELRTNNSIDTVVEDGSSFGIRLSRMRMKAHDKALIKIRRYGKELDCDEIRITKIDYKFGLFLVYCSMEADFYSRKD